MTTRLSLVLSIALAAAAVVAVVALGAPRDAAAQTDPRTQAKAHYQQGKKLYDQGDYRGAIAEFQAADRLAPSGVNDFNIGLAHEALGERAEAIRAYRSYLVRMPDASNKPAVEASIQRLQAELDAAADADAARRAEEEAARRAEEEARRAEEEAARRAEEDARKAPPPDGAIGNPFNGAGGAGGAAGATTSTGDPELDRVAAVDVGQVRAQRSLAPPMAGGGDGGAQGAQPAGGPAPEAPKAKPIYKQWWFWVVAGVSAYVLINILASDSNDVQAGAARTERLALPPVGAAQGGGGGGGLTWRF